MTPRWARPIWDPDPPAAASNLMRAPRTSTIVDGRPLGRGLLISIPGDAAASTESPGGNAPVPTEHEREKTTLFRHRRHLCVVLRLESLCQSKRLRREKLRGTKRVRLVPRFSWAVALWTFRGPSVAESEIRARETWASRSRALPRAHPSRPGSVGIESQRRWCDPGRVPGRRAPHRRPPRGRRPRARPPEPDPPGPDTRRVSAGPEPRTRR